MSIEIAGFGKVATSENRAKNILTAYWSRDIIQIAYNYFSHHHKRYLGGHI